MDLTVPSGPKEPWATPTTPAIEPLDRETINHVVWRLMPVLLLGHFCACLDRVNIGLAAFQWATSGLWWGCKQGRIAAVRTGGFATETAAWAKGI